jgi:hypothetical protein
VHRGKSKHFAICRLKQPPHVFTADLKAPPGNAGDHIVAMACLVTQGPQTLDAGDLVSGRPVIFRQFGLDQRVTLQIIWRRSLHTIWHG